jgi:hypothetical protein
VAYCTISTTFFIATDAGCILSRFVLWAAYWWVYQFRTILSLNSTCWIPFGAVSMIKRLLLASTAVLGIFLCTQSSHAQTLCNTVQGPCASLATQTLQLNEETITTAREIISALTLSGTAFQDLTNDISQIQGIINTANMLVGNTGQILQNISVSSGYPLDNISNWHQQFTNEANAVGLAMTACGEVTNILQGIANDAQLLTSLVNQVMTVLGRQQSLQTISSQLSELGQSLEKIEGGANSCRQGFATYQSAQEDHQYLTQSYSDRELEATWVNECAAIAQLDGVSAPASICAGAQ